MTQFLTPDSQILNYLVFPRFLLEIDDLNETAKILYMILLDRARLSQKNDRWTDENGHVYLFFTIPSLADARIYDRILERCIPVKISRQNIREMNAASNLKEVRKLFQSDTGDMK